MPQETLEKEELIKNNMALVPFILDRMKLSLPVAMTQEDALQYGYIGLVEAASRFHHGQYKFSTYASQRIRGAILDGVDTFRWFSVRNRNGKIPVVYSFSECLEKDEEWPDDSFLHFTEAIETVLDSEKLKKAFLRLTEEEQRVLILYYVNDQSLRRISSESSMCRNKIVALKRSALSKLKEYFRELENSAKKQ